jgi:hypothetical protein
MTAAATPSAATRAARGGGRGRVLPAALETAGGENPLDLLSVALRAADRWIAPEHDALEILPAFFAVIFVDGHIYPFSPFDPSSSFSRSAAARRGNMIS